PENRIPFEKPDGYDERNYELLFRSIEAGQKDFCTFSPMPNHKTDSNNNLAVSTDFIGGNWGWPEGSYEDRDRLYRAHLAWQQGLMWTLQNHPRTPENIRETFRPWGLAKDEFADNGHWPYTLYIREGRRMVGDFVVSERHLRRIDPTLRPVGMGSYNMDSHHIQRYVATDADGNATVRNEGDVQVNPGGPYPIDYGALLPKQTECDNLLTPVCVSCTHIAYGSIRMEPVFMILGQSAATAAVLSIESDVTPQELPYETLRRKLLEDGQILEWTPPPPPIDVDPEGLPGVVVDDTQAERIGTWIPATAIHPYVGTGYLHDANEQKGAKSVVFRISLPEPGDHEIRLSYPAHPNRATNIPVTVQYGDETFSTTVNQRESPSLNGLFTSIGKIRNVETPGEVVVTIGTSGTDGYVIVDSVIAIPDPVPSASQSSVTSIPSFRSSRP
ncbi:MAG: FAD-dependent oxidoreductase, partial [Planctomycetia bacterium]|nr:FAD-dependent oxidoreductase [Planctomycetia bacterium]